MFDIFNMLKKEAHTAPKQVTRDTIIGDILDMDQTTAPYRCGPAGAPGTAGGGHRL